MLTETNNNQKPLLISDPTTLSYKFSEELMNYVLGENRFPIVHRTILFKEPDQHQKEVTIYVFADNIYQSTKVHFSFNFFLEKEDDWRIMQLGKIIIRVDEKTFTAMYTPLQQIIFYSKEDKLKLDEIRKNFKLPK